jgi:hypothetical protein
MRHGFNAVDAFSEDVSRKEWRIFCGFLKQVKYSIRYKRLCCFGAYPIIWCP